MFATINTINKRKPTMNSIVTGQRSNQLNYSRTKKTAINYNLKFYTKKNTPTENRQNPPAPFGSCYDFCYDFFYLHFLRTPP
tara:strand:- start:36 stop:281 length:246 start_codon:yes stop_codon:yes gene_type:complete